ncbi:ash family protein [Yersinia alsatica]|uniref:ash family protein n=1 Tax=Yersinia alsatica TaxID=2890317 RepID=UPI00399F2D43
MHYAKSAIITQRPCAEMIANLCKKNRRATRHGYICKTMVSWAGASKDAPDSLLTGSSNLVQFTTHNEIGTSRW